MTATHPQPHLLPPLLETCRALTESVRLVKSQLGSAQMLRAWQPLQEDLPLQVDRMLKLVKVLRIFHSRAMLPLGHSQAPQKLGPLVEGLNSLHEKLLNRPTKVMEGNTWAKSNTGLSSAAAVFEENLKAVWRDYIGQLIPNLDDLRPFLNLDRCAAELRIITNLQNDLKSIQEVLPDDEDAFQRADQKSREIQNRVAKLDLGDIPPAVKHFIGRVNSLSGANLEDLTDEVLSWLREKNLLQSFRVSNARR